MVFLVSNAEKQPSISIFLPFAGKVEMVVLILHARLNCTNSL